MFYTSQVVIPEFMNHTSRNRIPINFVGALGIAPYNCGDAEGKNLHINLSSVLVYT